MDDPDENQEYIEVVNTLMNMFGSVMSKDVIFAVVESCGGDLNLSADAIMNINDSGSSELHETNTLFTVSDVAVQSVVDSINASMVTDASKRDTNVEENRVNNVEETNILQTPLEFLTLKEVTANVTPVSNNAIEDFISLDRNSSKNITVRNFMHTYSSTNTINTNAVSDSNNRTPVEVNANISDNSILNLSHNPPVSQHVATETLIPISRTDEGFKAPERVSGVYATDVTSRIPWNEPSKPSAASIFLSNSFKEFIPSNIGTRPIQNDQPGLSYASMSRNTGAVPKYIPKTVKSEPKFNWPPQLESIIRSHNSGQRTLILMRGMPGSGKSYLARQVIEVTVGSNPFHYKQHVFSTDDYFSRRGTYDFNKNYLSVAHEWNQNRVKLALEKGFSPVIVDNTNVEFWEMEPYLRQGIRNGYIIHLMEPETPWARKPSQLFRKNQHGVPIKSITRMLDNFRDDITADYLIEFYRLSYPDHMKPPVMRNYPPIDIPQCNPQSAAVTGGIQNKTTSVQKQQFEIQSPVLLSTDVKEETDNISISPLNSKFVYEQQQQSDADTKDTIMSFKSDIDVKTSQNTVNVNSDTEQCESNSDTEQKQNFYIDIEKQLEEMEKVEREWENGEEWDENVKEKNKSSNVEQTVINDPKPPRNDSRDCTEGADKLLKSVNTCQDWRQISMFMPPWTNENMSSPQKLPEVAVEMRSSGTCMEIDDTDVHYTRNRKIISATPRNINEYYMAPTREIIPVIRMLDKSTMTNERLITEAYRCKNEERHFVAFRKMFKTITKSALRDIFDRCCGDVNWAVEIVLDGMANNQLESVDVDEMSDLEDENSEQCSCLAAYNIVPDTSSKEVIPTDITETSSENVLQLPRKIKKEIPVSDLSLQLKRQIEQNFVIPDNYYSDHCLKIRKMRRGEYTTFANNSEQAAVFEESENAQAVALCPDSTNRQATPSHSTDSDNESSNNSFDEIENIVNINVGREFISELDNRFGRKDMTYPDKVEPKISIPAYLLNEINALWMESLMYQLDENDKQSAIMVKQDADFARQLTQMELELEKAGKEPEVPDFKEIMDMDFAIALYQKDIAEWRNKEPNDLAAKLSRDKLYNLFPELSQDTLSELLMAHDNNFQTTVEVLLMSTGKANILEDKNGLNKFVMEKEIERQERILAEEKKALAEVEWPLLPQSDNVDMGVVNNYRIEADKHLARRNTNYQKAQEYVRRGMLQVASYYSDIATFHKQKFDQANSLAAASLIQVHAANNPDNATVDLHYLRVGEAKESLDLFLDMHINKLREYRAANRGPREHTLFFITGRGLHSAGRPRVKPAVKKRLKERGLIFSERNPGLLSAKVSAEDKLSHQVQQP